MTSAPSCLSSALLPSSFVVYLSSCTRRRQFLSTALVYYCFLVFRRIGEYISLDLFYVVAIVIVITGSSEEEEDEKVSK